MNSEHVKMIKKLTLKSVALAGVAIAMQAGATTITVTPWLAPNAFGSPSFVLAQTNALTALYSGAATAGAVGPSQFNAQTTALTGSQTVVTGFASWRGVVDPGTVFGAAYAAEGGNRMHFGVLIDGQGSQFSISQLSFEGYSTDAGHVLNFNFPSGAYDYSEAFQGIRYGLDGHLGGGDDIFVTAGLNTQLVDGLVGRGSGNSLAAYCPALPLTCDLAAQHAAIAQAATALGTDPIQFNGTYALTSVDPSQGIPTGSGTFNINAGTVPEPGTAGLLLAGLGILSARRYLK